MRIASHFPCCLGGWILIKRTGARTSRNRFVGHAQKGDNFHLQVLEGFSSKSAGDGTKRNALERHLFQVFPHFHEHVEPLSSRLVRVWSDMLNETVYLAEQVGNTCGLPEDGRRNAVGNKPSPKSSFMGGTSSTSHSQ